MGKSKRFFGTSPPAGEHECAGQRTVSIAVPVFAMGTSCARGSGPCPISVAGLKTVGRELLFASVGMRGRAVLSYATLSELRLS